MMPAAKHGDPQLGVDIHLCMVPPSPSPVPLPTPHISVVFDPFDYVPILGATVTVCGMKCATAGTGGIAVHIPPGFPFAPKLPDWDDELFMGSSTVIADANPFSYIALPVLSCQIAGMMAPPRPKKKGPLKMMVLPLTFNLAIPTGVFVGGAPTVSLMGLAFRGAFAALGKLAKSGLFKRIRQKVFKNMKPGFLKCKVLRAEPVNILTGEVSVEQEDFTLPGRIAIEWVRSYSSGSRRPGVCGVGWETPADARLEIDPADDGVTLQYPGVGPLFFARLPAAEGDEAAELELMDGARLTDHGDEYRVRTKDDRTYHFRKALAADGLDGKREIALGRVSDLCGNWLELERHAGRFMGIQESAGRRIVAVLENGRVAELSLHAPGTETRHVFVRYEYDAAGDLVAVIDALGNPYRFAYDDHHLIRHTSRTGLSFYYEYDTESADGWRVVHSWGDGGLYDYRFVYDDLLNERRITDSLGHVWVVTLDARGLPINEIDPLGGATVFEYDDAGRATAVVDPAGLRTEYEYDGRGNLVRLTRPDGSAIRIEFDADNRPTRITDPNGGVWEQTWDSRQLQLEHRSPLGAVTSYEYGPSGLPITMTGASGAKTTFGFDGHGFLVSVTDALGNTSHWHRDTLGNVLAATDPLGRLTSYRYDVKGRLIDATSPDGTMIRCSYDAQDLLTHYVDENGAHTRFEYFGQGLLRKRHQPDGHVVEYHYDTEEQLIGVTNQRGEIYRFHRDALGRVIEEADYWGQSTTYRFSRAGHLRQSRDPLGRTIFFTTDELGRIRSKRFAHPLVAGRMFEETFDFDANGNLIACANEHVTVRRQFDAEGRLLQEKQGNFAIKNEFDVLSRRMRRDTSAGNTVVYEYDTLGGPAAIRINDESSITFECDPAGQVIKETLPSALERHYSYDNEGRLTAQRLKLKAEWLFQTLYEYDPAANLTRRHDTRYGVDRYRYDGLGQIVEHIDPEGRLKHFLQDPAGDRLLTRVVGRRTQQVVGGNDTLEEWSREGLYEGAHYRFDRAGNLTERWVAGSSTKPDDEEPRIITLTWDANQRLARSWTNGVETTYGYDPLGRRIFKQDGSTRTLFGWDGDALVAEIAIPWPPPQEAAARTVADSTITHKSTSEWTRSREYVYYPVSFVPLILVDPRAKREGEGDARRILYYHNDLNGCPTCITDQEGHVTWAARFGLWGNVDKCVVSEITNSIRLQGQYEDRETGLHYNRYRYYDPDVGNFISQDPLGLITGPHLSFYAPNSFTWSDPLGLAHKKDYHSLLGAVIRGDQAMFGGEVSGGLSKEEAGSWGLDSHTEPKFKNNIPGGLQDGDKITMWGIERPCTPGLASGKVGIGRGCKRLLAILASQGHWVTYVASVAHEEWTFRPISGKKGLVSVEVRRFNHATREYGGLIGMELYQVSHNPKTGQPKVQKC